MVWCSTGVVLEWCSCGGVFLVVWCKYWSSTGVEFLWWCGVVFGVTGGVVVFLFWCGGVFVFLWWCFCMFFLSRVDFRRITEKLYKDC